MAKVRAPRLQDDGEDELDSLREGTALVALLRPLDPPELAARLAG